MAVKFDFSDVDEFFRKGEEEVKAVEREAGKDVVEHAVRNGSYQDRTGRLRKSNGFDVNDEGLTLKNETEYAPFVEAKGFEVLSGAALEAERLLKERIG